MLRRQRDAHPEDFQIQMMLAATLQQLDYSHPDGGSRIPEAEEAYRAAIKTSPNSFVASTLEGNLGALLLSAGRMQEALAQLDKSIDLGLTLGEQALENVAGAVYNKGKVLAALGQHKEAQATYRQARKLSRGVAASTWTKASTAVKDPNDAELQEMREAVASLNLTTGGQWEWLRKAPPSEHCWLYFALYAAYDAKGRYEEAWKYLATANGLRKGADGGASEEDEQGLLKALLAFFPPPQLPPGPSDTYGALMAGWGGFKDPTPVFVVGMPRSGSTLIEQILASHPSVIGAGEDTALAPLVPSLLKGLEGVDGSVRLEDVAAVGRRYVALMKERFPASPSPKRIVDKMLRNSWNVGYINFMLPEAQIVWAVRHPMDVLLSCFVQPFEGRGTAWAWDLEDIATQIEMTHAIMTHWERVMPGRVLRMPYEALVADQEASSRRLLTHCGLAWHPAVINFHKTQRSVRTASQAQVRKSLYASAVGKWRRYERQLEGVRRRLQPIIEEYEGWPIPGLDHIQSGEL